MMKRSLFAVFLLTMMTGEISLAQSGGQNSLLPEIDPQDIEIRSEFKARFPGLRRQPILGFNPKPRIFRMDPNRMPFMETPEQAVASISLTQLDRPEPPARTILRQPNRTTAFIRGGVGSYISPELQAYAFRRLNEKAIISGDLNFESSDGHLNNQDAGFRFFDFNGVYSTKLKKSTKASVSAGVFNDFNHLFELSGNVPNDNSGTSQKSYQGVHIGAILQGNKNALEGWEYYINTSLVGIGLDAPNAALEGDIDEQSLKTGFEKKWAGKELYETYALKFSLDAGNYSSQQISNTQWAGGDVRFAYQKLLNFNTQLNLEGGLAYINDGQESRIRFVTDLGFAHTVNENVRIEGSIFARPELKTMWEHHQQNRFLGAGSVLGQEYRAGIKSGLRIQPLKGLSAFANVSYEYIDNLAYYTRSQQTFGVNNELTFYGINFENGNKIYFDIGATQQLVSDKLWFDAVLYAQSPKLSNGDDVPFQEKVGFNGAVTFKPLKALSIKSWMQYTGERTAPATNQTLSGFLLVNAGVDYEINNTFGLYIKVLNILGEKYQVWEGYQERPFQVFGGIKLKI